MLPIYKDRQEARRLDSDIQYPPSIGIFRHLPHAGSRELRLTKTMAEYYIGVDVGTGSARACVIDHKGEILALASKPIQKWSPKQDHFNQSSQQIWESICYCTRKVVEESKVDPAAVKGIGFDATCSLVVLNKETNEPVSVGPDFSEKANYQNILLWMDHRAGKETKEINKSGDACLKYVGGQMSLEMEIPKVKWLKNNMPAGLFDKCKFYDLADFLTHKATGAETRSYCSVVCKQGFVPVGVDGSVTGWSKEFLTKIGLEELCEHDFEKMGGVNNRNGKYLSAGDRVGFLTDEAAKDLGLTTGTAVGSGVIDAYAGWIGTVAAKSSVYDSVDSTNQHQRQGEKAGALQEATPPPGVDTDSEEVAFSRLAAVAGTSTCHLVMSKDAVFVPGVWGPYRDVVIPDRWMAEGGQSTTGELLAHVLSAHPAYAELKKLSAQENANEFDYLNRVLDDMQKEQGLSSTLLLAKHYFFYGDLYGNRSPIADPSMRGSVVGMGMDVSIQGLALAYLGAVEFIAQQTRHIIEALNGAGHKVTEIYLSGGQCRNNLLTQTMATATGMPIVMPKYIDAAVVLGSAFLGAKAAAKETKSLWHIMRALSGTGNVVRPRASDSLEGRLLAAKYKIFLDQAERQRKYRDQVDAVLDN